MLQPIALCDIIESHDGHLSHLDCTRPHTLTLQERALLFVYCLDHTIAYCLGCDTRFRMAELAVDPVTIGGADRTSITRLRPST